VKGLLGALMASLFILLELFELLEYLHKPKLRYPSLDVAIAEIALGVRAGRIPVDDLDFYLNGFSEQQKNTALSILYKTEYLTILDVDFQDMKQQMLFFQALATSASFVYFRLSSIEQKD